MKFYEAKRVMKVSVITPTYNREQLLKETMDSILNQTFTDFELIIVDNYSTDNTEKIVKSYNDKRIRYFKNHNNGIVAVNRNFGIKKSGGELIAFCDDDDLWMPKKLEKQILEFKEDSQVGLVCTNGFSFDKNGIRGKMGRSIDHYLVFDQLLKDNTIPSCSVMVRKRALDEVGIFDESQEILTEEDYELWLRIATKFKIKYIGTQLVKYRVHAGTFQSTYLKGVKPLEIMQRVYKKLLEKEIIDFKSYKKACNRLGHRIIIRKIVNGDNTINLETIRKTNMTSLEKFRATFIYLLFRVGMLRGIRQLVKENLTN
jgi:glycosyltransferase involved in cell wall biosynthesis